MLHILRGKTHAAIDDSEAVCVPSRPLPLAKSEMGNEFRTGAESRQPHTITYTVTHVDLDQINPTLGISFQHGPKVKKKQRTAHNSAHKQNEQTKRKIIAQA
jgi:hypothetical protein